MNKKDVLEELSYSLSEKERIILLDRINKNVVTKVDDDEEHKSEDKEKERIFYIDSELKNIGWFRKLFMIIRCRFSGKNIGEIIIDQKIKRLKKIISRKQSDITGFESRNLTPEFGKKVFELYSQTFAFREPYRKLWIEPGVYESCCMFIIRAMYEDTRNELDEFITMDELVDLYAESGKKDEIIYEVDNRIY